MGRHRCVLFVSNHKLVLSFVIMLVFSIILSSATAASSYTVDAPVTSGTKMTASEWYSTAKTRAMLTLNVSIDTLSQYSEADSESYSSLWLNSSWVGLSKSKNQVMVAGYYSTSKSTTILVMIYTPSTGKIEYMPIVSTPAMTNSNAEMICEAVFSGDNNTSKYEKNDPIEIMSIISDLQL